MVKRGFAGRSYGSGVVDIFAEICTEIDSGHDQVRPLGQKFVQRDNDAVGWRPVDGPFALSDRVADDGLAEGQGLRGTALFAAGGDDADGGEFGKLCG